MPANKGQVEVHKNILSASGLNGASITSVDVWRSGIICVVEIAFTGGTATSPYFIKTRGGFFEYGGTAEWNTGSQHP